MNEQSPVSRLNYSGSLELIIERLCSAYRVGEPSNFSIIEIGYEDCNVVINTSSGIYVAKIFSKERKPEDIDRYSTIMEKALEAGVNHPPLLKTSEDKVTYKDDQVKGISLVLMRFIDGKTFFEMDRPPNDKEKQAIIEQAAKVNSIDFKPLYLFDSWAIPNIQIMFDRVKRYIKPEDLGLAEQTMAQYAKIPVDILPHCFVHGDFTKANILKGNDGKEYILDFSVANWYPRIQELAVIAANLLHDSKNHSPLSDRVKQVAEEYNRFNSLSELEHKHLYAYTLAGVAMEFMGAHQEKYINGNDTEETEYWLSLGREGLREELK